MNNKLIIIYLISLFFLCCQKEEIPFEIQCDATKTAIQAPPNYAIEFIYETDSLERIRKFIYENDTDGFAIQILNDQYSIINTTTSGQQWTNSETVVNGKINDIELYNSKRYAAITYSQNNTSFSTIQKYNSNSNNWEGVGNTIVGEIINFIIDADKIFCLILHNDDKSIMKSEDFGVTWELILTNNNIYYYQSFELKIHQNKLYLPIFDQFNYLGIINTIDNTLSTHETTHNIFQLYIISDTQIVIQSSSTTIETTDGGLTWEPAKHSRGQSVFFDNQKNGISLRRIYKCQNDTKEYAFSSINNDVWETNETTFVGDGYEPIIWSKSPSGIIWFSLNQKTYRLLPK